MKKVLVVLSIILMTGCQTIKPSDVGRYGDVASLQDYSVEKLNRVDSDGFSTLYYAVATGNYDVANYLIDIGVDPDSSRVHTTPLGEMLDIIGKNEEEDALIYKLLKKGANPNATYLMYGPLLHHALKQNRPKYVQVLLDYGADPFYSGEEMSSMEMAMEYQPLAIVMLAKKGVPVPSDALIPLYQQFIDFGLNLKYDMDIDRVRVYLNDIETLIRDYDAGFSPEMAKGILSVLVTRHISIEALGDLHLILDSMRKNSLI